MELLLVSGDPEQEERAKIFGEEPQHCCTPSTSPLELLLSPPAWSAHTPRQKLVGFCDLGRPKFRKKIF